MAELVWNKRVLEAESDICLDIQQIVKVQTDSSTVSAAVGGYSGGSMSVCVGNNGVIRLLGEVKFGSPRSNAGIVGLSLIETLAGIMAMTGSSGGTNLLDRLIDTATGQFMSTAQTVEVGIGS